MPVSLRNQTLEQDSSNLAGHRYARNSLLESVERSSERAAENDSQRAVSKHLSSDPDYVEVQSRSRRPVALNTHGSNDSIEQTAARK